jgi:hypothetical protein
MLNTCAAATSTVTVGAIDPGLVYLRDEWQIGAEAIIPINARAEKASGWMASINFYLDRIFPEALGRPFGDDPLADHDHSHGDHAHGDHAHGDHAHGDHALGDAHRHDHGGPHAHRVGQSRVSMQGSTEPGHSH